jgi:hypothetical protein
VGVEPIPENIKNQESTSFATDALKSLRIVAHDLKSVASQDVIGVEQKSGVQLPERLRSLLTRQVFLFDM